MNQKHHLLVLQGILAFASKSWFYALTLFSFTFISCARYYYAPNSNNIPLLSEKEAKINAQYLAGTISKGVECQSAFAVSRHFGGMINTMVGSGKEDGIETNGETKTTFIEIAPGYFTSLGSTSLIFETYGGIGTGGVKNTYDGNGSSKLRNTRYFIQPSLGVKVKGFEFGLSSRWSLLRQKVVSNTTSNSSSPHSILEDISERPESILWEPSFVLRAGGEKFLVQVQYTISENLSNPGRIFAQEVSYFSIGFSIPVKYKTNGQ